MFLNPLGILILVDLCSPFSILMLILARLLGQFCLLPQNIMSCLRYWASLVFKEIMYFFVVSGTRVPDTCRLAEEQTHRNVECLVEPLPDMSMSMTPDTESATDVVWTAVEKGTLVELVDQLATVRDSCGQIHDATARAQPIPTADRELRRREESTSGDLKEIHGDSAATHSEFGQMQEQYVRLMGEQDIPWSKSVLCHDDIVAVYPCPNLPESNEAAAAGRIGPATVWKNNRKARTSEDQTTEAVKGSSEAWTSVDKTLVEDLFDHILRSFDDVKVGGPEAVEIGYDGSRGPPSANRTSFPYGVNDVTNDRKLWQSVAYKWKSRILLRMHTQQVANNALCRKRRYSDRKLIHNSAYGFLEG